MSQEDKVEVEVTDVAGTPTESEAEAVCKKAGDCVGQVISSFVDTLEAALTGRGNTVMVRVNDEALAKLDMLVAAGICKSRSESAAFLLQRGIQANAGMYDRISDVTAQITGLRQSLLEWVQGTA